MRAQQDFIDFISTLMSDRQNGYAKSYYWDYVVNNVRLPKSTDFGISEPTAEKIRREINLLCGLSK